MEVALQDITGAEPVSRGADADYTGAEKWVSRLFHSAVMRSTKAATPGDSDPVRPGDFAGLKPYGVSYSQKLAPRGYVNKPFAYEFLDRVRERANRDIRGSHNAGM
jgi:hypothetical protein